MALARDLTDEQSDALRPIVAKLRDSFPGGQTGLANAIGMRSQSQLSRFLGKKGGLSLPHAVQLLRLAGRSPGDLGIEDVGAGPALSSHPSWREAAALAARDVSPGDIADAGDFVAPGAVGRITPLAIAKLVEVWNAIRLRAPAADESDVTNLEDERREREARKRLGEPAKPVVKRRRIVSGSAHR